MAARRAIAKPPGDEQLLITLSQDAMAHERENADLKHALDLKASTAREQIADELRRVAGIVSEKATAEEAAAFREWIVTAAQDAASAAKEGGFIGHRRRPRQRRRGADARHPPGHPGDARGLTPPSPASAPAAVLQPERAAGEVGRRGEVPLGTGDPVGKMRSPSPQTSGTRLRRISSTRSASSSAWMMLALFTIRMSRPSACLSAATSSAGSRSAMRALLHSASVRVRETHLLDLVEPDREVPAARRRVGIAGDGRPVAVEALVVGAPHQGGADVAVDAREPGHRLRRARLLRHPRQVAPGPGGAPVQRDGHRRDHGSAVRIHESSSSRSWMRRTGRGGIDITHRAVTGSTHGRVPGPRRLRRGGRLRGPPHRGRRDEHRGFRGDGGAGSRGGHARGRRRGARTLLRRPDPRRLAPPRRRARLLRERRAHRLRRPRPGARGRRAHRRHRPGGRRRRGRAPGRPRRSRRRAGGRGRDGRALRATAGPHRHPLHPARPGPRRTAPAAGQPVRGGLPPLDHGDRPRERDARGAAGRPRRGVIARTDMERGVQAAPAGAPVLDAVGLVARLSSRDTEELAARRINAIVTRGVPLVWGARTASRRPGVEVRERAAALHLPRALDRRGDPVGGVRAERRTALGARARPGRGLPVRPVARRRAGRHDARARPSSCAATARR